MRSMRLNTWPAILTAAYYQIWLWLWSGRVMQMLSKVC